MRRSWKRRLERAACEPFVEGAVVGGELADALFEGGVLGGDALDRVLGPLGFQVADLAEEFADAGALGEDLGVGGLERVLGVECAFPPGRLVLASCLVGEIGWRWSRVSATAAAIAVLASGLV